jgi:hypothetical protein
VFESATAVSLPASQSSRAAVCVYMYIPGSPLIPSHPRKPQPRARASKQKSSFPCLDQTTNLLTLSPSPAEQIPKILPRPDRTEQATTAKIDRPLTARGHTSRWLLTKLHGAIPYPSPSARRLAHSTKNPTPADPVSTRSKKTSYFSKSRTKEPRNHLIPAKRDDKKKKKKKNTQSTHQPSPSTLYTCLPTFIISCLPPR